MPSSFSHRHLLSCLNRHTTDHHDDAETRANQTKKVSLVTASAEWCRFLCLCASIGNCISAVPCLLDRAWDDETTHTSNWHTFHLLLIQIGFIKKFEYLVFHKRWQNKNHQFSLLLAQPIFDIDCHHPCIVCRWHFHTESHATQRAGDRIRVDNNRNKI